MESINIKTKTKYAYDELKRRIIEGELSKGSRLIIQDLANELSISSTPVREALAKLEAEGLIETHPHVGAIVMGLNLQRIREITLIRSELEYFAICNLPQENLALIAPKLQEFLKKMERSLTLSDEQVYFDLTWDLTNLVLSNCGNRTLYQLLMDLRQQSNFFLIAHRYIPISREASYQAHVEFCHMLMSGDLEGAAARFRAFKIGVRQAFIEALKNRGMQTLPR